MSVPGSGTYIADARIGSVQLERNYNMEDPASPLDDPSIWNDGILAASGKRVSPCSILHLPAALQAVERISGDIARCPLEPWSEQDGVYAPLRDDPLYRLCAIQPNREMDAFTFWQRIMVFRLIWRNAYIFIAPTADGRAGELLPLLPDRTEPKRSGGVLYYETTTNGNQHQIPASKVIHIQGVGFDGLKAMPLQKLMRDAFGLALAQMDFVSKVYRGGGRRGGVLEIPLGMPKVAADKLEEGFRRKYEEEGQWFTTVILRENAKFHDAQMTLRDSQSIEGREESVRDVARAFNIRPGHLGIESSGVYGNKADDTRDYLDMTLRPHMAAIQAQCRSKLLPPERQAGTCFGHNTDELLQMSVKEEFEAYGAGVNSMLITPNEGRGKLGFKPHPDGDKLGSPHTKSPKESGGGGTPPAKRAAAADQVDDEEDEDGEYDALDRALDAALATQLAQLVAVLGEKAERAAASGAKFCAWLDEKFEGERAKLRRAIGPLVACLSIRRGDGLPDPGDHVFNQLRQDLQAIANEKSEAELKPAVTEYFNHWSHEPCPQPKSKAA